MYGSPAQPGQSPQESEGAASSGSGGGITARSSGERGTPRDAQRLALGERRASINGDWTGAGNSPQHTARSMAMSSEAWSDPSTSRGGCLESLRYFQHLRRPSMDGALSQAGYQQQVPVSPSVSSSAHLDMQRHMEIIRHTIVREHAQLREKANHADELLEALKSRPPLQADKLTAQLMSGPVLQDEIVLKINRVCAKCACTDNQASGLSCGSQESLDAYPTVHWNLDFQLQANTTESKVGAEACAWTCNFTLQVTSSREAPELDVLVTLLVCIRRSMGCVEELGPEVTANLRGTGGKVFWSAPWPFPSGDEVDLTCHVEVRDSIFRRVGPMPLRQLPDGGIWEELPDPPEQD